MIANSLWLLQRALPVILLATIPQFTRCSTIHLGGEDDGHLDVPLRVRRAPFNSWAGKRSTEDYENEFFPFGRLEGLHQYYLQHLQDAGFPESGKRAPFNSWAGKRAPFNSWAGKRAPFNSWAGKRAPFNSWAGKRSSEELTDNDMLINHGDDRFGDSSHSHRQKRSSGEYVEDSSNTETADDRTLHARPARAASQSRRVRSNTAFSAWGGK